MRMTPKKKRPATSSPPGFFFSALLDPMHPAFWSAAASRRFAF
jgi:hypothetical protein